MIENQNTDIKKETRNVLLAALVKAQGDNNSPNVNSDERDSEDHGNYIFTKEELTALLSGNMEVIENWVSNLDRRHATRLLRWLIRESA